MRFIYQVFSIQNIYKYSGKLSGLLLVISAGLIFYAIWVALTDVPADYQQGNSFRIFYIHVPSAWMSLMIYVVMAISSLSYLIWQFKLSFYITKASAPVGAIFTLIALVTGSLWGKPTWGTYWVWDARLTSELILFFIYTGYLILVHSVNNQKVVANLSSILCLVGIVNIPIIYFSVEWWNTLHQGSTINFFGESTLDSSMLKPLIFSAIGTKFFYAAVVLIYLKNKILLHHCNNQWLIQLLKKSN